jgi:predicted PurR-regulated permease PerM
MVSITVIIFICFFVTVLAVLAYQISDIATDFDKIKRQHFITDIQKQIRTNFNISLWSNVNIE